MHNSGGDSQMKNCGHLHHRDFLGTAVALDTCNLSSQNLTGIDSRNTGDKAAGSLMTILCINTLARWERLC